MGCPIDRPKFKWRCSYQGKIWYDCWDETGMYELELRRSADDYERKFYNGNDDEWQRNNVAMIGVLRRSHNIDQPVPDSTFQAFNEWLESEFNSHMAHMKANPQRYGDVTDYEGKYRPKPARAAARWIQTGYMEGHWIITAQA